MTTQTIEELERNVDEKRAAYLGVLEVTLKQAGIGSDTAQQRFGMEFTVQTHRLFYEEALGQLQRRLAYEAQTRNEAMQRSIKNATWVITIFTILATLAAIASLLSSTCSSHH